VSASSSDGDVVLMDDDNKIDSSKKLKQAKNEYYRHVEAALPLLCRYEGIRLEQKKKDIMIEKKLIIRYR
jgi:hypothetical protein